MMTTMTTTTSAMHKTHWPSLQLYLLDHGEYSVFFLRAWWSVMRMNCSTLMTLVSTSDAF
jgi:hypothetical protein